jgi:hypothetical protein
MLVICFCGGDGMLKEEKARFEAGIRKQEANTLLSLKKK